MDINSLGMGSNYLSAYGLNTQSTNKSSDVEADKLKSQLNNISEESSDEELMDACKSFEAYMINNIYSKMRKSVESINENDEDDNEYIQMFGDNLYEEYVNKAVENSSLGLAQMLFDSIKRGQN